MKYLAGLVFVLAIMAFNVAFIVGMAYLIKLVVF